MMIKALELQREVLGEKHPDTVWSMAELARTHACFLSPHALRPDNSNLIGPELGLASLHRSSRLLLH
jgi:hypothetical protein